MRSRYCSSPSNKWGNKKITCLSLHLSYHTYTKYTVMEQRRCNLNKLFHWRKEWMGGTYWSQVQTDLTSLTSYQASDLWASSQQHVLITMLKVLLRHSTQTCFVSFPFWTLYPSPNNLMAPPLVRFFSLSLFNQLKGFIGTLLLF